jgi:hypothetical protein
LTKIFLVVVSKVERGHQMPYMSLDLDTKEKDKEPEKPKGWSAKVTPVEVAKGLSLIVIIGVIVATLPPVPLMIRLPGVVFIVFVMFFATKR